MICQQFSIYFVIFIIASVATDGSQPYGPSGNNNHQHVKGQLMSVMSDEVNDKSSTIKSKNTDLHTNLQNLKGDSNLFSDYDYLMPKSWDLENEKSSEDDTVMIKMKDKEQYVTSPSTATNKLRYNLKQSQIINKSLLTPGSKAHTTEAVSNSLGTDDTSLHFTTSLTSKLSTLKIKESMKHNLVSQNIESNDFTETKIMSDGYTKSQEISSSSNSNSISSSTKQIYNSYFVKTNSFLRMTKNRNLKNSKVKSHFYTKSPNNKVEIKPSDTTVSYGQEHDDTSTKEDHTGFSNNYSTKTSLNNTTYTSLDEAISNTTVKSSSHKATTNTTITNTSSIKITSNTGINSSFDERTLNMATKSSLDDRNRNSSPKESSSETISISTINALSEDELSNRTTNTFLNESSLNNNLYISSESTTSNNTIYTNSEETVSNNTATNGILTSQIYQNQLNDSLKVSVAREMKHNYEFDRINNTKFTSYDYVTTNEIPQENVSSVYTNYTSPFLTTTFKESESYDNSFTTASSVIPMQENIKTMSPQRVEYNEDEIRNILWSCPPEGDNRKNSFIWHKLSNETKEFSTINGIIDPKSNTLEIKNPTSTDEGRYVCISRENSPFISSKIYFYQLIILKTKWIDIGLSNNVSLYFNQKLILNCPHGDLMKNGTKYVSPCSSRITILEQYPQTTQDTYRCSNSLKETTKLPALNSSMICSLSLSGCSYSKEKYDFAYNDRCISQLNDSLNAYKVKRCPEKISIRFYYNIKQKRCLPFQTDICGQDYYSFSSYKECEHHCSIVNTDIQLCFYPQNIEREQKCEDSDEGVYMTSYNIDNNDCEWFYHRKGCQISKNAFTSLRKCRQNCMKNKKLINIEMKKVCNYNSSHNSTQQTIIQRWVYLLSINDCVLINILIIGDPFVMVFTSKNGCLVCKSITNEEICQTKPNNGKCKKEEIKWHFNIIKGKCIRILDGGCGDSLNRFNTKRNCERKCSRFVMSSAAVINKTTATSISTTATSMSTTSNYDTKAIYRTTINKRVNREIPNFQRKYVTSTIKSNIFTQIPKGFDVSKRILDSDPCLGKSLMGVCDYGINGQNYTLTRYSFVPSYGQCHRVLYSGCMGGENLFDDANDCKASCEHRLYHSLKSKQCQSPYLHGCATQSSNIDQHVHKFHYSSKEDLCLPFPSLNTKICNKQYFNSSNDCYKVCRPKQPSEAILQNKCYGKMMIDENSCLGDQKIQLWFYMSSIKQCLQYSTCPIQIEGNAFLSRSECEENCQATNIFTICNLPPDPGMGTQIKLKYFYDNQRRKCQFFSYKGSMGNFNRFRTKEECSKVCDKVRLEIDYESQSVASIEIIQNIKFEYEGTFTNVSNFNMEADREYCFDNHKYGACNHFYPQVFIEKYYYNAFRRQCEPYLYSGCGATSRNSFDSVSICDKMCTTRLHRTASSICSRKSARCSNSSWIYWVYNTERGSCELFPSCIQQSSTELFFTDDETCSRICTPSLPQKKDLFDICHLSPTITHSCSIPHKRWFFDDKTGACFFSLSCESYGNNFASLSACQQSCDPRDPQDVCKLPDDVGPCSNNTVQYYFFHWKSQRCTAFDYGGCLGNRNRFLSLKDCQAICPNRNRCNIQTRKTDCKITPNNHSDMFKYSSNENQCMKINETLCGNYFDFYSSKNQCENDCVIMDDFKTIAFSFHKKNTKIKNQRCQESLKFNSYQTCLKSQEWLPRFYFEEEKEECTFYYYNGCDGLEDRGNRFLSFELCRDTCYNTKESTTSATTTIDTNPSTQIIRENIGICPTPHNTCSSHFPVNKSCQKDSECSIDLKCCECDFDGSLVTQCMEPIGCMLSSFGCCSGTENAATDILHMNCSRSPPKFVNVLKNVETKANNTYLQIECFVMGDPRPNISWTHLDSNRSILTETRWDLIQPLWSSVLKINGSTNSLSGLWICHGSNEMGEDDIEFMVSSSSQSFKPTIRLYDRYHINSTIRYTSLNSNSVLHCPIYGIPRPSIKWLHNNTIVLKNNDHLRVQGRYIFFNHISFIYDGSWVCIGEQSKKFLLLTVELRIREPLQILPSPHGNIIRADIGQKVILFCNVIDKPRPHIIWKLRKEGVEKKLLSHNNIDKRIFVISSFNYDKRGDYICIANNDVSKDSMTFVVTTVDSDDIVVEPAGFHFVGDHITLHCPVKPRVKIQHVLWKKDSVYMKTRGLKLNFILHSKLDSGFYTCHHGGRSYKIHIYVHQKALD